MLLFLCAESRKQSWEVGPLGGLLSSSISRTRSVIRSDNYLWAILSGEPHSQKLLAFCPSLVFQETQQMSPVTVDFIFNHMKTKRRENVLFHTQHPPFFQSRAEWFHPFSQRHFRVSSQADGKSQSFYGNPLLIRLHLGFSVLPPESGSASAWKQMFVKLMKQRV